VEGHAVIQRLNDAFDAQWSFEIVRHDVLEDRDEVIVLGKLTADNVVKTQFGTSRITRARETGEIVSLGQDLKAAATDALKKTATLLGVGLHLYQNGNGSDQRHPPQRATDENSRQYNGGRTENGGNGDNRGGNSRITNRQLNYAVDLGKGIGWNSKDLDEESVRVFGVKMAHLTVKDASVFIESLKAKAA